MVYARLDLKPVKRPGAQQAEAFPVEISRLKPSLAKKCSTIIDYIRATQWRY